MRPQSFNLLIIIFCCIQFTISAKDVATLVATSEDISSNLDLEVVASVFGDSKDLEDFEKRRNDPEMQILNLDLNNIGEVNYLRPSGDASHSSSRQAPSRSNLRRIRH